MEIEHQQLQETHLTVEVLKLIPIQNWNAWKKVNKLIDQ